MLLPSPRKFFQSQSDIVRSLIQVAVVSSLTRDTSYVTCEKSAGRVESFNQFAVLRFCLHRDRFAGRLID
ncbi:hypothetical protein RRSWK_06758 [Rhodopirellula sp. SWK7]|nr:hypothetical protein RRSWK_06758 [Rhodopirellula sp. SWK7]